MEKLRFTGGAKIGILGVQRFLAILQVMPKKLILRVPLVLGDKYEFLPHDVVAIEKYGWVISRLGGILIKHTRQDYPKDIVFWCSNSSEVLIDKIKSTGFEPSGNPIALDIRPNDFPFKWTFVITFLVFWSILITIDIWSDSQSLGDFGIVALLLIAVTSTLLLLSTPIQNIALKPKHQIGEVRFLIKLLLLISSLIGIPFAIALWL